MINTFLIAEKSQIITELIADYAWEKQALNWNLPNRPMNIVKIGAQYAMLTNDIYGLIPGRLVSCLFFSTDLVNWTKDTRPIYDDGFEYCIGYSLKKYGNLWVMPYVGPHGGGGESINIAVGSDYYNMTPVAADYVIKPGVFTQYSASCFVSGFEKIGDTYYMGVDVTNTTSNREYITFLVTSTDLVNWTNHGLLIEKGYNANDFDYLSTSQGYWLYQNNLWHYFYIGNKVHIEDSVNNVRELGYATSPDITGPYTKRGVVFTPTTESKSFYPFYNQIKKEWEIHYYEKRVPYNQAACKLIKAN